METQEHTTVIPVQQVPPTAVMQQTGVAQRQTVNVSAVRVLAIIEIMIGLLTITFGLVVLLYAEDLRDFPWIGIVGIVVGPLISVAGAVGIVSYKDPENHCKNGLRMAFSIFACCVSVVGIGFFSTGVAIYGRPECRYRYRNGYDDLHCYSQRAMNAFSGILLFLVIAEFIVALTAAIFTCMFACCGTNGCCDNSQKGVIMYSGNQQYVVTSASGQTVMVPAYPPGSFPHYVSSAGTYTNQAVVSQTGGVAQFVSSVPYFPNQVVATQASTAGELQGATNVTYSSQGPPPSYVEKEQPVNTS